MAEIQANTNTTIEIEEGSLSHMGLESAGPLTFLSINTYCSTACLWLVESNEEPGILRASPLLSNTLSFNCMEGWHP